MATRRFKKYSIDDFERFIATVPVKRNVTNLQIHHCFKPNLANYAASNNKESVILGMWSFHTVSRGFRDIAQHFTIAPDGIWDGRTLEWDSGGFLGRENDGGICFEMIGNFDIGGEPFTGAIADNAYRAVAACLKRWPKADIRFHREQPSAKGKTCPGTSINKASFVAEVNKAMQPKSASSFIADKTGIGAAGWTQNETKHPAYGELARIVSDRWDELDKIPYMGEWFRKVGEKLGN